MSTTFEMLITANVPTFDRNDFEKIIVQTEAIGTSQAEAIADAVSQVEALGMEGYINGISLKSGNVVMMHHDETFEDFGLAGLTAMMKARGVELQATYRSPSETANDLSGASDAAIMAEMVNRKLKVWTGTHAHKHGETVSLFATEEDAVEARLEVAIQGWSRDRADRSLPDDPEDLSDDEILRGYYRDNEYEFYEIGFDRIIGYNENLTPEHVESLREPLDVVSGYGDRNTQDKTL